MGYSALQEAVPFVNDCHGTSLSTTQEGTLGLGGQTPGAGADADADELIHINQPLQHGSGVGVGVVVVVVVVVVGVGVVVVVVLARTVVVVVLSDATDPTSIITMSIKPFVDVIPDRQRKTL